MKLIVAEPSLIYRAIFLHKDSTALSHIRSLFSRIYNNHKSYLHFSIIDIPVLISHCLFDSLTSPMHIGRRHFTIVIRILLETHFIRLPLMRLDLANKWGRFQVNTKQEN